MMKPCIHQSFYKPEQEKDLDPNFIPYNNVRNLTPHLREYPIMRHLFCYYKGSPFHWGLVSTLWNEKTHLSSQEFIDWIVDNPGYDCYHIDPYLETLRYSNMWVQGDVWHPGMIKFMNRLLPALGIDQKVEDMIYKSDEFASTSYCVGNNKFWTEYILFLNDVLVVCSQDEELYSYLYKQGQMYNGTWVPYFSFVVERMRSLFYHLNRGSLSVLKFPITHKSYTDRYGKVLHDSYIDLYNGKL